MPTKKEIKNAIQAIHDAGNIAPEYAKNQALIIAIRLACEGFSQGNSQAPVPEGMTPEQVNAVYEKIKNPGIVAKNTAGA